MDKQIRIVDSDLRDPPPADQSAIVAGKRGWKTLRTLAIFSCGYALLHKLLVPLVYRQAVTDFWILPILAWLLILKNQLRPLKAASFFMGALVAQGLIETYWVFFSDRITGWTSFSHLLAAWPLALTALAILNTESIQIHRRLVGIGALSALAMAWGFPPPIPHPTKSHSVVTKKTTKPPQKNTSGKTTSDCGSMETSVIPTAQLSEPVVKILPCGFAPSWIVISNLTSVNLSNQSTNPVNVHFYVRKPKGFSNGWNVLLVPGASTMSPKIHLEAGQVAVLFSDAQIKAGMVGILTPQSFADKTNWNFWRDPLQVEPKHEL